MTNLRAEFWVYGGKVPASTQLACLICSRDRRTENSTLDTYLTVQHLLDGYSEAADALNGPPHALPKASIDSLRILSSASSLQLL